MSITKFPVVMASLRGKATPLAAPGPLHFCSGTGKNALEFGISSPHKIPAFLFIVNQANDELPTGSEIFKDVLAFPLFQKQNVLFRIAGLM